MTYVVNRLIDKDGVGTAERGISWFARKIGCDRSTVYRIFQKNSIDTQLLKRISVILNHDFFADLSMDIAKDGNSQ